MIRYMCFNVINWWDYYVCVYGFIFNFSNDCDVIIYFYCSMVIF